MVLAAYLRSFIDGTASVKPSRHPSDKERLGFTVGASATLGREALEDLIEDTRAWDKEQNTREFEDRPYDYQDSDTWTRRKRLGCTPPRTTRIVEGRRVPPSIPSTQYSLHSSISSRHGPTLSDNSIAPSNSTSGTHATAYRRPAGGKDRHDPSYEPRPNNGLEKFTTEDQKGAGRDKRSQGRGAKEGGDPYNQPTREVPEMLQNRPKSSLNNIYFLNR